MTENKEREKRTNTTQLNANERRNYFSIYS